jgi:hypothetical protein
VTKLVVGFLVMVVAQVALAQANPDIAYSKTVAGKGKNPGTTTVYVANADGSNTNAVWQTNKLVGDVEVSPDGTRLFIIDDKALRSFDLVVSGSTVTATNELVIDTGMTPDGVATFGDWSADSSSILYMNYKSGIAKIKIVDAATGSLLFSYSFASVGAGFPKFVGSDQVAYLDYCSPQSCVKLLDLNTLSTSTVYVGPVETIEAAHLTDSIIVNSGSTIKLVDVNTSAELVLVSGSLSLQDGVLSDDDTTLYYRRALSSRSSDSVIVKRNLLTNTETLLTSGSLRNLDAH